MNRRSVLSYPLLFLLLVSVYACNNNSADRHVNKQANPNVTVYVGQIYPSQHVIVQPIVNKADEFTAWPENINVHPLIASTNKNTLKIFQAKFMDKISNTYIPLMESMPNVDSSKCAQEGYHYNTNSQYLLKNDAFIQDYFSRGMPDNCAKEDKGARYKTERNVTASYPILAVSSDNNLTVDYQNAGKLRPLSMVEQTQVAHYLKDFKTEYRQAYEREYNEKTDIIGEIPTLARAEIMLEAQIGKTGYHIRVSTWERITAAYHIYRIIEVTLLKKDKIINSNEISRYQGVLG